MSFSRFFLIAWLAVVVAAGSIRVSLAQATPKYSIDEAVTIVKKDFSGRVLRATPEQQDGRTIYEIRILTDDGLVRTIIFDAESGQVE
jgi:uncharacterized membrane protein YkoI